MGFLFFRTILLTLVLLGSASLCAVSPVLVSAAQENLLQNPSLETVGANGDPDGWLRGNWGTNTALFTYPVAGTDGASAAKVEITNYTDGDAKWYFADVPVTGGKTYIINYDCRSNVPTEILARITLSDGGQQYVHLATLPAHTDWGNLGLGIPIPENGTHVTLFHVVHSVGWLEIDNFLLF
jgi:hypothetical protein